MKIVVPDYYPRFHCIAERCRHNCCIGWEIDIDEATDARYRRVGGAFGDRLRDGIDRSAEQPCFKLGAGERCVFLNERGLCDIIATLGEEALCEICASHPRFRNFFSDRVEVGLGLCCEEACRVILTNRERVGWLVSEDDGGEEMLCEEEREFLIVREKMLDILQDRGVSMDERMRRLEAFCGLHGDPRTPAQWAEVYRALERLDPAWDACLDRLAACDRFAEGGEEDVIWEQLAVYFLCRYTADSLDDGALARRVSFCLHALRVIRTLCAGLEMAEICEVCRMYSCEIEYSEVNVEALMAQAAL